MCKFFGVSRSSYYAYLKSTKEDRDHELAIMIRQCQKETDHTYGYNNERIQLKTKLTPLEKRRQFA